MNLKTGITIAGIILMCSCGQAQKHKDHADFSISLTIQRLEHKWMPWSSKDYKHSTNGASLLLTKEALNNKKYRLHWLAGLNYHYVTHQLLNPFFIKPDQGNTDALREFYQQKRNYHELSAQLGIRITHPIHQNILLFLSAATGPLIGSTTTERLAKGLAFDNQFNLGTSYRIGRSLWIDISAVLRHTSNAGTKLPNSGHNSTGVSIGIRHSFDS